MQARSEGPELSTPRKPIRGLFRKGEKVPAASRFGTAEVTDRPA